MDDLDDEILENLGTVRRNLRFILSELAGKSRREGRLEDILNGCRALLDEVEALEEEYADRAAAEAAHMCRYGMEDVS